MRKALQYNNIHSKTAYTFAILQKLFTCAKNNSVAMQQLTHANKLARYLLYCACMQRNNNNNAAAQSSYAVNVAHNYSAHCYNSAQQLQQLAQCKAQAQARATQRTLYALQVIATQQYVTFALSTAKFSATRACTVQYTSNVALASYSKAVIAQYAQALRCKFTQAQIRIIQVQ